AKRTWSDFVGDVAISPDGKTLYAAALYHNSISTINAQTGAVVETFKVGRRPYRILPHPDGQSIFVSSWADATLYQYRSDHGQQLAAVRLGAHPTDIVWRDKKASADAGEEGDWKARLFVSAANTNNVYVVGVTEASDLKLVESVN